MFKKTLNFSDLKTETAALAEMKDGDVYQIFHRGQEVKVLMTQEYFFTLMERLERAEGTSKSTPYNPDKLMKQFEEKMARIDDLLKKSEQKR